MKKISENLVIRAVGGKVQAIQSDTNFTYTEDLSYDRPIDDLFVCVNSDKFFATYSKDSEIALLEDGLLLKSKYSEVTLPFMKEYGVFNVDKEIIETGEGLKQFKADFKKLDLDLTEATGQYSYVMISECFVSRYLYNTFQVHGKLTPEYYCLTPKQFKQLQSLGECLVMVYEQHLVAITDTVKVVFMLHLSVIKLDLINRFIDALSEGSFVAPAINLKKVKLFSVDGKVMVYCKASSLSISAPGFTEVYEIPETSVVFNAEFNIKDLEYLYGEVSVYRQDKNFYCISREDDKLTLYIEEEK